MIILLFIIAFLIGVLSFILISPLRLVVDTRTDQYSLRWKGIFNASFHLIKEPIVRLQVLGFRWNINLFKIQSRKKAKKKNQPTKSKKTKKIAFRKMIQLLKTFKIRFLKVNLDTDDFILNGYTIPIFNLLKSNNATLRVNYSGVNEFQMVVENRLYRLLKAYLF